jgi:hypothetical protein
MQTPGQWLKDVGTFKAVYQVFFLACAAVVVSISAYGIVASFMGHVDVVGQVLVSVEIPPTSVSPVTVKPISILMAATLGLTYSGLELARPAFAKFSNTTYSILKLIAFVGSALAAYEVMYNFTIWTAEISTNSLLGILNPDVIINQFPNPKTPWNLVFATKLSTTLLAMGLYVFYYVRQVEREKLHLF